MSAKSIIPVSIISLSIIVSVLILSNSFINRNKADNTIAVTGLSQIDFESDLIVWRSYFSVKNATLTGAYAKLKEQNEKILDFLIKKGLDKADITFSAVDISKDYTYIYNQNGSSQSVFDGYTLSQTVNISSTEVKKIETISREITELINQGIEINSYAPEYYYTKLADLKIAMLAAATEDGQLRAKTIAENGGGRLGGLKNSTMGVFQIVAVNSAEEYSWGGSFNTSSKQKTASVTVRLLYNIK
ncbi:MAG: SIMPL domain-containing protein [Paludibacteraceae bacterium]|nr:SIMPL domain-containing protein [Paludibacteraceae bacterium]MBP6284361.1 SIMPL domain-containing protein [Paludibacteraceae bacterium]